MQELFSLMENEHGLTLTQTEMQEIISISKKIIDAQTESGAQVPCSGVLCRLPREAIEVEDDWQLVQDHVEDENWTEVPPALSRMREKMLKLEAYVFAKKVLSA